MPAAAQKVRVQVGRGPHYVGDQVEIAVIADDSADPALVACDLLGQAEHDPNSGQILVCLSEPFARRALAELDRLRLQGSV